MSPCPQGPAGVEASPELLENPSPLKVPDLSLWSPWEHGQPWLISSPLNISSTARLFPLVKSKPSKNSLSNLLQGFNILSLPLLVSPHMKYSFPRHKNTLEPLYPKVLRGKNIVGQVGLSPGAVALLRGTSGEPREGCGASQGAPRAVI